MASHPSLGGNEIGYAIPRVGRKPRRGVPPKGRSIWLGPWLCPVGASACLSRRLTVTCKGCHVRDGSGSLGGLMLARAGENGGTPLRGFRPTELIRRAHHEFQGVS